LEYQWLHNAVDLRKNLAFAVETVEVAHLRNCTSNSAKASQATRKE